MAKVLLVEDEENIASFIERGLQEFGYEVSVAANGETGWELIQKDRYQLLLLDVIVPKINGLDLCRMYRERYGYKVPVLILTALGTTDDIVKGLNAGADDYVVKPFRFMELEARVRALLRRADREVREEESRLPTYGELSLDPSGRRAIRKGKAVNLTQKEYYLLEFLLRKRGTPVSREALLRHVWEDKENERTNVVDVYVNYLRNKIDKGFRKKLIRTVTGVGYMIGGDEGKR
jgi:DNA-binding response OmpR family regulator